MYSSERLERGYPILRVKYHHLHSESLFHCENGVRMTAKWRISWLKDFESELEGVIYSDSEP